MQSVPEIFPTSSSSSSNGSQRTEPVFFAEFNESYSFRNLVEYLKNTNVEGNFVFTKDLITYTRADASNTILNEVIIRGCDLTYYIYNSPLPEIIIGLTIANLRRITKPIGKKDSVRLYMLPSDPLLYIQIISVNTKALSRNNANFVKPQLCDTIEYDPGTYTRSEDSPNCTIPVMDFCRMCTAHNSLQNSFVTVRGLPRGVIFEGIIDGDITGRIDKFGIVDNIGNGAADPVSISDNNPAIFSEIRLDKIKAPTGKAPKLVIQTAAEAAEIRLKIKVSTIKALSKLNNLSTSGGIIKIYIEKDLPIKLVCNIGTYGKLIIYLRDADC